MTDGVNDKKRTGIVWAKRELTNIKWWRLSLELQVYRCERSNYIITSGRFHGISCPTTMTPCPFHRAESDSFYGHPVEEKKKLLQGRADHISNWPLLLQWRVCVCLCERVTDVKGRRRMIKASVMPGGSWIVPDNNSKHWLVRVGLRIAQGAASVAVSQGYNRT